MIPLSAGYPALDLIPLEALREATDEAIERLGARMFQYGPIEGAGELRAASPSSAARGDWTTTPTRSSSTTGARQALTLVARATLRAGDKVACESPSFMGIIEALRTAGAEVLPVPIDEEGLDIGALEQLLRHHEIKPRRDPAAPAQPDRERPVGRSAARGSSSSRAEHGFFILEDGVYGDLRFEGRDPGPLRALAPNHVIYVDSLSKTVGPGLRAGWVAASGPVLDRVIAEKRRDDAHGTTLTQQSTAALPREGPLSRAARARARRATASAATCCSRRSRTSWPGSRTSRARPEVATSG